MKEDLLRDIAGELNKAPETAARAARMKALVDDTNGHVAAEAMHALSFDSSPNGFADWLAKILVPGKIKAVSSDNCCTVPLAAALPRASASKRKLYLATLLYRR